MSALLKKGCCCGGTEPDACSGCGSCPVNIAWDINVQVEYQYPNGDLIVWSWDAAGIMSRFGTTCLWSPAGNQFTGSTNVFSAGTGGNYATGCTVTTSFPSPAGYPISQMACSLFPGTTNPPPVPSPTYWIVRVVPPDSNICPEIAAVPWPGPGGTGFGGINDVVLVFDRPLGCPTSAVLLYAGLGDPTIPGDLCWVSLVNGGTGSCVGGDGSTRFVGATVAFT